MTTAFGAPRLAAITPLPSCGWFTRAPTRDGRERILYVYLLRHESSITCHVTLREKNMGRYNKARWW